MSSEWKTIRLGDYCLKIGSGATPQGGKESYLESGAYCLFRSQNVHNDGFKIGGLVYLNDAQAKKLQNVAIEVDDVLLNITGDSVARVCLAPTRFLPARVNQHVVIIRPKTEFFDSRFIRYFLVSPIQQDLMLGLASTGGTRNALTKSMIEDFKIPCPSLAIQKAIADILSALDDRITLLRETNATLEAIAQALFKSWFVDFDPVHAKQQSRLPEGMDEQTAALFPDSFEESELGLVPLGWEVGELADIVITAKKQLQVSNLTPELNYVGLEHIPRKSLSLTDWGNAERLESAKSAFSKGDILFGKLRPYFHKVVVAPFDGVCSTDILVCQPKIPTYYGITAMLLFSTALISYAERLSNGAKMPRVNWKDLANYPVCIPPEHLAANFTETITPLFSLMVENVHKSQTLADLRDTLLPRLISGQLRVGDVEKLTT
jgi:type I restriction enzyme S subunit